MFELRFAADYHPIGMFATMHRLGSPLTSGRIAMWKCIPILFISPVVTTFVNGHDLLIYLLIIYTFIITLLVSFRNLLHEWTTWLAKVPSVKEKDLMTWYNSTTKEKQDAASEGDSQEIAVRARLALRVAVHEYRNRSLLRKMFSSEPNVNPFVKKMGIGHPYALWLLEKEASGADLPEIYTTTWFVQLELAFANQRQLTRGLKEHSQFITFRYSKYDVSGGQITYPPLSYANIRLARTERRLILGCSDGSLDRYCHERETTRD
jgi:hypothetical protein